jgi:serine/threonine protein kinase
MWKASRRLMAPLLAGLLLQQHLVVEIQAWSSSASFSRGQALVPSSVPSSSRLSPIGSVSSRSGGSSSRRQRSVLLAMKVPTLDDWKVLRNGRVQGTIKNHPSIPDGDVITTSPISRPDKVAPKKIVETASGTKYQLGQPKTAGQAEYYKAQKISIMELQRRSRVEYDLTGEVVGDATRQYLLSGRPSQSTSGKSKIYKAFQADADGLPVGESLTVKLSKNWEAIEREAGNYAKITKSGFARGQFVQLIDYLPTASTETKKFKDLSALVMERGSLDLKRYLQINGPLEGKDLRDAASAAAQCLQAVHQSGLVWTDMKTENFIVTSGATVKGIDLESAMPVRDNPVDYSPEATPPEFAAAFLGGDGPYFVLECNYDMWSLGMLLYEVATGRGYFDGKSPVQITRILKAGPTIELDNVDIDPKLRDLMRQCLQQEPRKRPSIAQVLLHPYFLTSGIGPWSW